MYEAEQSHLLRAPKLSLTGAGVGADLAGAEGVAPCIGLIIVENRGPKSSVFAFHFDAEDCPEVLYQFKDRLDCDYIVFGGDNSAQSNLTLEAVLAHLPTQKVTWVDSEGVWADQNGELYMFKSGHKPANFQGK